MLDYKSKFPLGARVVGVVSLILSIYMALVSTLFLVMRFTTYEKYCDHLSKLADAQYKDSTLASCTMYLEYALYGAIGTLIYGLSLLIVSSMLLSGVSKNSNCLMVPYLLWSGIQIVSLLILSIAVSAIFMKGGLMAASIITSVLIFLVPCYFWLVVYRHRSEAKKINFLNSVSPVTPINGTAQPPYPFRKEFPNDQTTKEAVTRPTPPLFSRRSSDDVAKE